MYENCFTSNIIETRLIIDLKGQLYHGMNISTKYGLNFECKTPFLRLNLSMKLSSSFFYSFPISHGVNN